MIHKMPKCSQRTSQRTSQRPPQTRKLLMAIRPPCNPCTCQEPEMWCEKHQRYKTPHLRKLCRTREDYRQLWDTQVAILQPQRKTIKHKNIRLIYLFKQVFLIKQIGRSILKWVRAGRPLRSLEEIRHIYDTTCVPCEYFDKDTCLICGCRIKRNTKKMNKLSLKTEICPHAPPKWGVDRKPTGKCGGCGERET